LRIPDAGKFSGQDNDWAGAIIVPAVMEFNKSIVDFPSIERVPGVPQQTGTSISSIQTIRTVAGHEASAEHRRHRG
jgi:hypothetical protein